MKFIAKPNTWYDEGTEAYIVDNVVFDAFQMDDTPTKCGLFCGIRGGFEDEEVCDFNEFEIIEDEDVKKTDTQV